MNKDIKEVALVLAGSLRLSTKVKSSLEAADYVIAVDKGLDYLHELNLEPDLVIGDFDTVSEASLTWAQENNFNLQEFPEDKDKTDGNLALDFAKDLEPQDISLYAAFSSARPDHAINILAQAFPLVDAGIDVRFYSGDVLAIPLIGPSELSLDLKDYTTKDYEDLLISLVPISEVKGVYTKGLAYPLKNANLYPQKSLSLSNCLKSSYEFVIKYDLGKLISFILEL